MIASINATNYSANTDGFTSSPLSSGDPQVFQSALSAASSTRDAGPSAAKPNGTVIHDRKVHHRATSKSDDAIPNSAPVSAPTTSSSTLPPMAPTTRNADVQPKRESAVSVEDIPATEPEPGYKSETPQPTGGDRNDVAAAAKTAPQRANGAMTEHEATLGDAIATAQDGSIPMNVLSAGQVPPSFGNLAAFPVSGALLRGMKGLPTTEAHSAASAGSPTLDRPHKAAASDDPANSDSAGTNGGDAQDQTNSRIQVVEMNLPEDALPIAHNNLAEALTLDAAPVLAVHPSISFQLTPTQVEAGPAANLAILQPDAPATPFVSSATLIQSIQQSDMRVGLNSLEFGSISIHTSTERGVISSQITLGHEALARTITSHLTATQATPGIPQLFSVRVETSSPTAGDSPGHSHQSPDDRQQSGRTTQTSSTDLQPQSEYTLPIPARNLDGPNARLDIHI